MPNSVSVPGGQPLSRSELETVLLELGAWGAGTQTRPLSRDDVLRLMRDNSTSLGTHAPSGERLDLNSIKFLDGIDLSGVDFSHADLRGARLAEANLSGATMIGVD